jgi:hypothetical protein
MRNPKKTEFAAVAIFDYSTQANDFIIEIITHGCHQKTYNPLQKTS